MAKFSQDFMKISQIYYTSNKNSKILPILWENNHLTLIAIKATKEGGKINKWRKKQKEL
jgi:hypothetical protein